MTILRFPDERSDPDSRYPGKVDAKVVILPVIPRVRPGWRKQNRRVDGMALLIKTQHPTVAVLNNVEPPCDVGCGS